MINAGRSSLARIIGATVGRPVGRARKRQAFVAAMLALVGEEAEHDDGDTEKGDPDGAHQQCISKKRLMRSERAGHSVRAAIVKVMKRRASRRSIHRSHSR